MFLSLLLISCTSGDPVRSGPGETGATDGGSADGGLPDGGFSDGGSSDGGSSDGGSSDGGAESPDADLDGWTVAQGDCQDGDPAIHPGQAEQCDGVDQDCNEQVDEGVPGDGAGCRDPGWPELPARVDTVHLTLRTGTGTYDGTDDGGVEVCLGPGLCLSPYKPEWNDLEAGSIDVKATEGLDWDPALLDRLVLSASDGGDLWRPVAIEVSLDGELVYCRDLDLDIGDESDELLTWTDPEGLSVGCDTAYDRMITHGPMIGAVGPDRARIWVRTDATRRVLLRVAGDEASLAKAAPVHYGYPAAADDFALSVEVVGLEPDRRYVYSLETEDGLLGPFELWTAPEPGSPTLLRLGFGSCSKDDSQPVFGVIHAWEPDLFLFIGDNHYGNTDELSDLRQFYRWAHERPLRSELLAETSILATWDDHDYTGNNTDGSAPGRDTALRVFQEYWANPSAGTDEIPGVFYRQAWGDVELFVLDDRYHRGLDGTLLGEAQQQWLVDALADSTATFKLVACGSQFSPDGSSDSWAAFPEAWDALREDLSSNGVGGVVLLSGDIHRFELLGLEPAAGGAPLYELTSSSLAYPTPSACQAEGSGAELLYCLDTVRGFVGIEIDSGLDDPSLTADFIDEDGDTHFSWTVRRSELEP